MFKKRTCAVYIFKNQKGTRLYQYNTNLQRVLTWQSICTEFSTHYIYLRIRKINFLLYLPWFKSMPKICSKKANANSLTSIENIVIYVINRYSKLSKHIYRILLCCKTRNKDSLCTHLLVKGIYLLEQRSIVMNNNIFVSITMLRLKM